MLFDQVNGDRDDIVKVDQVGPTQGRLVEAGRLEDSVAASCPDVGRGQSTPMKLDRRSDVATIAA